MGGDAAVAIERSGVTSQATQPQSQDLGQIPLESLLAVNAEETDPDSEAKSDAIAIDALESNIAGLQTPVDAAFADEGQVTQAPKEMLPWSRHPNSMRTQNHLSPTWNGQ